MIFLYIWLIIGFFSAIGAILCDFWVGMDIVWGDMLIVCLLAALLGPVAFLIFLWSLYNTITSKITIAECRRMYPARRELEGTKK